MSEYFKSLDSIARSRYLEKLSLLGLTEKDDTYFNTVDKFEDDLRSWPPVEFGHIFCYYLERPGVYTRQQLLQWKSLDGYNYFVSGHVRQIRIWCANTNCSLLMAEVNPSQASPDKRLCLGSCKTIR